MRILFFDNPQLAEGSARHLPTSSLYNFFVFDNISPRHVFMAAKQIDLVVVDLSRDLLTRQKSAENLALSAILNYEIPVVIRTHMDGMDRVLMLENMRQVLGDKEEMLIWPECRTCDPCDRLNMFPEIEFDHLARLGFVESDHHPFVEGLKEDIL